MMISLKDFLEKVKTQEITSLPAPSSEKFANAIMDEVFRTSLTKISNDEAEKFSLKVSDLATSDDVISDLSNELGWPKDHETEDEFVERAKSALTKILKNKLSK